MSESTMTFSEEDETLVTRARSGTSVVADRGAAESEARRNTTNVRFADVMNFVGSALGSLALAWLAYWVIAPFTGMIGFTFVWFFCFIGMYVAVLAISMDGPAVRDKISAVVAHALAGVLILALVMVIGYTAVRGVQALPHKNFFTQDMRAAGPLQPLTVGGIIHGVAGTLIEITIALIITIPLGVLCALFLNELPGKFSRLVRTIVEAMTALPSVIAGLFIYATWILMLGFPKSGLAAGLAISVMMLPIIIRASDVVLRLVPGSVKEASYALGAGQWSTILHVVLPTSRSGLMTAIILGTARGIGETSPVLLTAGFGPGLNLNPFSGPMVSLPLLTFELVKSPQHNYIARGFGTAFVLLALVLVLFIVARTIGGRGAGVLSKRQQRRRVAQSKRDLERFSRMSHEVDFANKIAGGSA
ncbi:MAG: phosphate ABC transporter permease PstA [Actinomycetes bacterium]